MSIAQCEECRLALVRVVFDPGGAEAHAWSCQLDEAFSERTRGATCPFFVGFGETLPPVRSCRTSRGCIDGCSTGGSCGTCGSSGGCGLGDPAEALEMKWDPEAVDEVDAATVAGWRVAPDVRDRPELHEEEPHRNHHRRDPEQVGEGPPLPAPVGKPSRVPTDWDSD